MSNQRTKEMSRQRAQLSRELDRIEAVPDSRALDRAIADGVAMLIAGRYAGSKSEIAKSRDLCDVLEFARSLLVAQKYDLEAPIASSRFNHRLRIAGARPAKRLTL